MSAPKSPFCRNIPSKSQSFQAQLDMTPRFLSLGDECLSRGLTTLAMALFLLGFLFVRLQFSQVHP
jgi:hypothetical protein